MVALFKSSGQSSFDDQAQQQKLKLAQALMAQTMQQPQVGPNTSPLAAILSPLASAFAAKRLNSQAQELDANKQAKVKEDMAKAISALQGTPEQVTQTPVLGAGATPEQEANAYGPRQGMVMPAVPGSRQKMLEVLAGSEVPELRNAGVQGIIGDSSSIPNAVRETQWFMEQNPGTQGAHMKLKRAPTTFNLGDRQITLDPRGGVGESYAVNLKPGDQPAVRGAQAKASVIGKEEGEQTALLADMQASLPRLESVVKELSALGQKATYTKGGVLRDIVAQEAGFGSTEGAVARKAYIAKVDNEILPLLRQTFGAAFTQKEGESLKATLGDPNVPPDQKDAVLQAFIETKRAQIETQKRRVGVPGSVNNPASDIESLLKKY